MSTGSVTAAKQPLHGSRPVRCRFGPPFRDTLEVKRRARSVDLTLASSIAGSRPPATATPSSADCRSYEYAALRLRRWGHHLSSPQNQPETANWELGGHSCILSRIDEAVIRPATSFDATCMPFATRCTSSDALRPALAGDRTLLISFTLSTARFCAPFLPI